MTPAVDFAEDTVLPVRREGAKAILLTVLGEFVLPAGGQVWTSSLVRAAALMDIGEKNARQALARVADQGIIESQRHGRLVRWSLTPSGRRLLETGAARIYHFGTEAAPWVGDWLVAHCPIPESKRSLRHQLRTRLAFAGFGELSPSLAVSPHANREPTLARILEELGLHEESVVLRSRTGSITEDADIVARAWNLDALAEAYQSFSRMQRDRRPTTPESCFRATVELVHAWRRFPFVDPELPIELLPGSWAGTTATGLFHSRREQWSRSATQWYVDQEARHRSVA